MKTLTHMENELFENAIVVFETISVLISYFNDTSVIENKLQNLFERSIGELKVYYQTVDDCDDNVLRKLIETWINRKFYEIEREMVMNDGKKYCEWVIKNINRKNLYCEWLRKNRLEERMYDYRKKNN